MKVFDGSNVNTKYLYEWYDFMFDMHSSMEDEISQVIYTNYFFKHIW